MHTFTLKPFASLTLDQYHRIVQAREAVFHLEQHVTCLDADDIDPQSLFLWTEQQGRVTSFLRIIPPGIVYPEASIGRVLVDAAFRRQGLCRRLMYEALRFIDSEWGAQPVRISAQEYLTDFYRTLGFEPISERYFEAGIPHIKMLRRKSDSLL